MARFNKDENIFNFKRRTADQSLRYPIKFGMDEEQIQEKLKKQGEINNEDFTKYMERTYMTFNQKINKCKLSCAERGKSYNEINVCYSNCEAGVHTFKRFVNQRIEQMQVLMNQCVSNARQLPDSVYETYHCYDLYNRGFSQLKGILKQESLFYQ